jgi:hypothetical protein
VVIPGGLFQLERRSMVPDGFLEQREGNSLDMVKKLLGIVCSPRKFGNSELLIKEFIGNSRALGT